MYNYAGQPWKAQKRLSEVMYNLYDTSPTGICGNEDTGQMSAWYVFSAMGFYPVTHGDGRYFAGTPLFEDLSFTHPGGTLRIKAPGASERNCYVKSLKINGKPYTKTWFAHDDLFKGNVTLEYEMSDEPDTLRGTAPEDIPWSLEEDRVVGISAGKSDGSVSESYLDAVRAAGFNPVVIPYVRTAEEASEALSKVEAIVFTGGADIDPAYYGETIIPGAGVEIEAVRDTSDVLLAMEALRRKLPILAICRGEQILNVVLGGSLYQDIPLQKGTAVDHSQDAPSTQPSHKIGIDGNSLLCRLFGPDSLYVNSTHHQAVKQPAPGVRITARTSDGIPEAYEAAGWHLTAVQFHPEKLIAGGDLKWAALFRQALLNHGFRNAYGGETVRTASSKAAMMVSPTGFCVSVIQHLK
jgi:gamma-glutamyl-gamma-aminobutyrate hydrolase PuuD